MATYGFESSGVVHKGIKRRFRQIADLKHGLKVSRM